MNFIKYFLPLLLLACAHEKGLTGEKQAPKQIPPLENSPTEPLSYTCEFSFLQTIPVCPPWATSEAQCIINRKAVYQCLSNTDVYCIAMTKSTGEPDSTNCDNFDWSAIIP